PPAYTASAPAEMAPSIPSKSPAGANNSTISVPFCSCEKPNGDYPRNPRIFIICSVCGGRKRKASHHLLQIFLVLPAEPAKRSVHASDHTFPGPSGSNPVRKSPPVAWL